MTSMCVRVLVFALATTAWVPCAGAQILDELWLKATVTMRLAEYAETTDGDTVVPPQAKLVSRRAQVYLHVEATSGDGVETDAVYDVTCYRPTKNGLDPVATTTMLARGGAFRALSLEVPLSGGKGGKAVDGTATTSLNGRFIVKSVNGQIVQATLTSVGGGVEASSYTIGDTTIEAVGSARLKGRSVPLSKLPPILEDD